MNVAQAVVDHGCYNGHITSTTEPSSESRCQSIRWVALFLGEIKHAKQHHFASGDLPHSKSLFILLVELPDHQHAHWADAGLKKAQEEALGVEGLVVVACCTTHEAETPEEDNAGGHTLDGEALCH